MLKGKFYNHIKTILLAVSIITHLSNCLPAFSQGVDIIGNNSAIDDRSSLRIFNNENEEFDRMLNIAFDFHANSYNYNNRVGYILRIKSKSLSNQIFNIYFNDQGEKSSFDLNFEGKKTLIKAEVNKADIFNNYWTSINLQFNLEDNTITLKINEESFTTKLDFKDEKWKPQIYFGTSDFVIDTPPYSIQKLTIKSYNKTFSIPLNESKGEKIHDSSGNVVGIAKNAIWRINSSYNWKKIKTLSLNSVGGYNYNEQTDEVIIFDSKEFNTYNLRSGEYNNFKTKNSSPLHMRLGTNFINYSDSSLYAYEVDDLISGETSIASLSLKQKSWKSISSQVLGQQLHHHSNTTLSDIDKYYIFGGFGNQRYSRFLYEYNIKNNEWNSIELMGDTLTPRYFSSMGAYSDSLLYVYGGMGNESGDQLVGRIYYYDMYLINLHTRTIKQVWNRKWTGENIVPVRNMIINKESNSAYTLCYPEHLSNSNIQLYKLSLDSDDFTVLGDSIPIRSDKIASNANLYYSKLSNKFIAITQVYNDSEDKSIISIYTLSNPPVSKEAFLLYNEAGTKKYVIIMCSLLLLVGLFYAIYRRLKINNPTDYNEDSELMKFLDSGTNNENSPNSLYLFGDFLAIDKNNKDISHLFSPRLKQALFLILHGSLEGGISTDELTRRMWPDKDSIQAKNLRGVTISNLRKAIADLEGFELISSNRLYFFELKENFHCDLINCLNLCSTNIASDQIKNLAKYLYRGPILSTINDDMLIEFKEYIDIKINPIINTLISKCYNKKEYSNTKILCKAALKQDPLNDNAFTYLIKVLTTQKLIDEAKQIYFTYALEYKHINGKVYEKKFEDIVYIF